MASDLSSFAAIPLSFVHKGKTYKVSLLKQPAKAEFERWVKRKSWQALQEAAEFLPPDELEKRKEEMLKRQSLGYYSYHGALCLEAQQTRAGTIALASILFGCSEDEMLEIAATRSTEVEDLLAQILAESLPSRVSSSTDEAVPNA